MASSGVGITKLIEVAQLKSDNANDEAMNAATKQEALTQEQRHVRNAQRQIEDILRDNDVTPDEHHKLYVMANEFGLKNADANDASSPTWLYYTGDDHSHIKVGNDPGNETVNKNEKGMNALKAQFEDIGKDLEAQDKLGNFQIQDLMSQYNQSQTLMSSVLKSKDETEKAPIQKIG